MHRAILGKHESESDADANSASSGNSGCSLPPRWEIAVTEQASAQTSPAQRSRAGETGKLCVFAHTGTQAIRAQWYISDPLLEDSSASFRFVS